MDERLRTWNEIRGGTEFTGILVGNGSSLAVWDRFAYGSLYEIAHNENIEHRLSAPDVALFEALATQNFELILAGLVTARRVNEALAIDAPAISERYRSIQRALVEAVHSTHVPWARVPDAVLEAVRAALCDYRFVYSTNYDLLIYWAIMHENRGGFKDFFWSPYFDPANTGLWGQETALLYLHGGLHLYRTPCGRTLKRAATGALNLLELFGTEPEPGATPLVITEGLARDKLESIHRSDYLAFGYSQLAHHNGPLCVFGHSLDDVDQHIVDAIRAARIRDIAFAIRQGARDAVIATKANAIRKLPEASLMFFDAASHPLGSADLRIAT